MKKSSGTAKHFYKGGYAWVHAPDHPCAHKGFVAEHRLVAERKVGHVIDSRRLHIHHIDGNPRNNHPDNLEVLTPKEHSRIHFGWWLIRGEWFKPCSGCNRILPATHDYFNSRTHDALNSKCKRCERIRLRAYKPPIKCSGLKRARAERRWRTLPTTGARK